MAQSGELPMIDLSRLQATSAITDEWE